MFTVYGVYLRESPRHHWEFNLAEQSLDRALALAHKWWAGDSAEPNGRQWAILRIVTDDPVNWHEQLGYKHPPSALLPNQINEGAPHERD